MTMRRLLKFMPSMILRVKLNLRLSSIGLLRPSPGVDPLKVEVRLFDKLFNSENLTELDDWLGDLNPNSKVVIPEAYAVPSLCSAVPNDRFQFERLGYFAVDKDSTPGKLVFNRTVKLRESNAKGGN